MVAVRITIFFIALVLIPAGSADERFGNYGTPGETEGAGEDLYNVDIDELHARCKFKYEQLQQIFPTVILNSFADTDRFDSFEGVDYTPYNFENYPKDSWWRTKLEGHHAKTKLVGALCDLPGSHGEDNWSIMRIGPFTSRGGYDWWQIAGHDLLKLSRFLPQGQLGINSHYIACVDKKSDRTYGFPPMHVHHFHIVPQKPYLRYQWPMPFAKKKSKQMTQNEYLIQLIGEKLTKPRHHKTLYIPNYLAEQHGEWDLCDIRNKTGCFVESVPKGFTRLVDFELDFEGEINDGREKNAPPIEWWLEVGIAWTHNIEKLEPVGYGLLGEDHLTMASGRQHTYENYYYVPTDQPAVNYHEGRMPIAGELLRMKHHSHMTLFTRSYFINAAAADLGLTAKPLAPNGEPMPKKQSPGVMSDGTRIPIRYPTVVTLQQLGFKSLDDFETALLKKVDELNGGRNRIVCVLNAGLREVPNYPGYLFDRAGNSQCNSWRFEKESPWTSIILHDFQPKRPGPWSPDITPKHLPMHNQWNIMFKSMDGASHYFAYLPIVDNPSSNSFERAYLREELLILNWRTVIKRTGALSTRIYLHFNKTLLIIRQGQIGTLCAAFLAIVVVMIHSCCLVRKRWKRD